jgi:hypothetical protein
MLRLRGDTAYAVCMGMELHVIQRKRSNISNFQRIKEIPLLRFCMEGVYGKTLGFWIVLSKPVHI